MPWPVPLPKCPTFLYPVTYPASPASLIFNLKQAQETARAIKAELARHGVRVELDAGSERLGKQIRNAEQAKIPVVGIIGAKVSGGGKRGSESRWRWIIILLLWA